MMTAEICFNFQNHGECKWGKDCRYLHISAGKSLCLDWKKGDCPRGDSCRFAHRYGADIIEPQLTRREMLRLDQKHPMNRHAYSRVNIADTKRSQSFLKNNLLLSSGAHFNAAQFTPGLIIVVSNLQNKL